LTAYRPDAVKQKVASDRAAARIAPGLLKVM